MEGHIYLFIPTCIYLSSWGLIMIGISASATVSPVNSIINSHLTKGLSARTQIQNLQLHKINLSIIDLEIKRCKNKLTVCLYHNIRLNIKRYQTSFDKSLYIKN